MNLDDPSQSGDFGMASDDLYREETFTDRRVGTIRRLIPMTPDGRDDATRAVVYVGQTQMLTPMGALPVTFEIPADSLEAAVAAFGTRAEEAAEQTIEELREMRRDAASSIVIPEPGTDPTGGLPGGGKIQF